VTRVRTIDVHIGWLIILAALIGAAGILIWAHAEQPPPPDAAPTWPTTIRTINGTITTPMPEDLDR